MQEVKKKIVNHLKSRLNDMIPGTPMVGVWEETIMGMSDKELDQFIQALENGVQDIPDPNKPSTLITLIVPNLDKNNRLSVERNLALAKKMGYDFFEQLWLTNSVTGKVSLTNRKYLSLLLPIRRQAQTLDAKMGMPDNDQKVDDLTGQVTGDSKESSISYPEIQMLDAQGLEKTILELVRPRGGDEDAWRLMKSELINTGEFSQAMLDTLDSRAKVNKAFSHILNGMHIRNNV